MLPGIGFCVAIARLWHFSCVLWKVKACIQDNIFLPITLFTVNRKTPIVGYPRSIRLHFQTNPFPSPTRICTLLLGCRFLPPTAVLPRIWLFPIRVKLYVNSITACCISSYNLTVLWHSSHTCHIPHLFAAYTNKSPINFWSKINYLASQKLNCRYNKSEKPIKQQLPIDEEFTTFLQPTI